MHDDDVNHSSSGVDENINNQRFQAADNRTKMNARPVVYPAYDTITCKPSLESLEFDEWHVKFN